MGLLLVSTLLLPAQSAVTFNDGLPDVFPNQSFNDDRVYYLTQAQQLMRNGQWEQAVLRFDIALGQQPEWIPALVGRSEVLGRMGRELESVRDRNMAYRLNRISAELLFSRGRRNPIQFLALFPAQLGQQLGMQISSQQNRFPMLGQDRTPAEYFDWQRERIEGASDSSTVVRILQSKVTGDAQQRDELLAQMQLEDGSGALLSMIDGNTRLLEHDYWGAISRYNDAMRQFSEPWPELLYNRGIAYLLVDNYNNGCDDLNRSVALGFNPAAELYLHVCNF